MAEGAWMRGRRMLGAAAGVMLAAAGLAVPATAQPGTAASMAVTRDVVVGRWTDNGDCSDVVEFMADGSFRTTGGATGRWTLAGDRLTFQGASSINTRVAARSRDEITLTHDDGSVGASTRCPASRRLTVPALPGDIAAAERMSRSVPSAHLIGAWTDDGNCESVIRFLPGGRFVVATGTGNWTLAGDQLTFSGSSGERTVRARGVGNDRILLIHPDGTIAQSLRC